jgi:flagellar biosynthesis activator protein FlaF
MDADRRQHDRGPMYPFSYAEVVEDSSENSRERDGQALDVSIALLKKADESGPESVESVQALYYATRLWSAFIEDLGRPENGLSQQLRAALISVGISVMREAERIRNGTSTSFKHLIEISTIVREGLR